MSRVRCRPRFFCHKRNIPPLRHQSQPIQLPLVFFFCRFVYRRRAALFGAQISCSHVKGAKRRSPDSWLLSGLHYERIYQHSPRENMRGEVIPGGGWFSKVIASQFSFFYKKVRIGFHHTLCYRKVISTQTEINIFAEFRVIKNLCTIIHS